MTARVTKRESPEHQMDFAQQIADLERKLLTLEHDLNLLCGPKFHYSAGLKHNTPISLEYLHDLKKRLAILDNELTNLTTLKNPQPSNPPP